MECPPSLQHCEPLCVEGSWYWFQLVFIDDHIVFCNRQALGQVLTVDHLHLAILKQLPSSQHPHIQFLLHVPIASQAKGLNLV